MMGIRGAVAGFVVVAVTGAALAAGVASAAPWVMPAHDLSGTRSAIGAAPGGTIAWRTKLAGGVASASAIAGGRVYAASVGGDVAAVDVKTGKRIWTRRFGTVTYGAGKEARKIGFFAGVALGRGCVIVASDRVRCLNPANGATKWQAAPLRTKASDDYFWGPPTILGDLALIGTGSGAETPTARGSVTAYNLKTGKLAWRYMTVAPGANGGGVLTPVTVDRQRRLIYAATGSPYKAVAGNNAGTSSLVALDARTGDLVWRSQVHVRDTKGFDLNSAPVLLGNRIFVTAKDGVYAWNADTRKRIWHRALTPALSKGETTSGPTNGPEGGPIATDGKWIYVVSNDNDEQRAVVAKLMPATGLAKWRATIPTFVFAAPAIAGGRLLIPGADGTLYSRVAADGSSATTTALGNPSSAAVSIAGGVAIVGTGAGEFLPGTELLRVS